MYLAVFLTYFISVAVILLESRTDKRTHSHIRINMCDIKRDRTENGWEIASVRLHQSFTQKSSFRDRSFHCTRQRLIIIPPSDFQLTEYVSAQHER